MTVLRGDLETPSGRPHRVPGDCWFDGNEIHMPLWQHVKYGDAVFRVEDAPLLKTR